MKVMTLYCFSSIAAGLLFCWNGAAQEDWTRHFRAGLLLGVNIRADFKTGGQFTLSQSDPGMPGVSGVDHRYDDGYVLLDDTGNAEVNGVRYTGNWGYDSPSQYDGANTLTFHSANSVDITQGTSRREDSPYIGLDLAYGGNFGRSMGALLGWEVGFSFLPISIKDSRTLSGVFQQTVHQFNTGGIVIPESESGYHGGFNSAGEPTIPDVATDITATLPNQGVTSGTIRGSRILDVHQLTLRLGPTFYWPLHHRWAISASAGGAVGLVLGDYRFDETATLTTGGTTHFSGEFGSTKPTYGGYVNAVALFHLQPDADLFVGAQFMPLTDVTFSKGGREAKLDLGTGFYFTAGINWPF
jgi:hypothetical protein